MLLGGPRKEATHVGVGSWRLHCFHMEDRLPRINLKAEAVELDRGAKEKPVQPPDPIATGTESGGGRAELGVG